jgi:hypothetical protein
MFWIIGFHVYFMIHREDEKHQEPLAHLGETAKYSTSNWLVFVF